MYEYLKPYIYRGLALLLLAHVGSFLCFWKLPWQKNPYTIAKMTKGYSKNNLADRRAAYRDEFKDLFEAEFGAYERF